jgi:hypothetical protein
LIRSRPIILAALLVAILAPQASAGITVTSYQTVAETNGYAPSLQGPYFAQQTLENLSPALAEVSGDWTGPNADGTPDTWHFVGTSQASSTTAFDANSYTVTAAGSFVYELNTSADFVDPRPSVFSPGGAANYRGFFAIDTAARYVLSIRLNQYSGVSLGSFESGFIFNQFNSSANPVMVQFTGTIAAAHYQILATTGTGPANLPNGINHESASGSFEDLTFVVQVPEPTAFTVGVTIVLGLMRMRTRN